MGDLLCNEEDESLFVQLGNTRRVSLKGDWYYAPEHHRAALLELLQKRQNRREFTADEAAALAASLESALPEDLMYAMATLTLGSERIGKRLLKNYAWQAYWDLRDPRQRTRLIEALS